MQRRVSLFVIVMAVVGVIIAGVAVGQDGSKPFTAWLPITQNGADYIVERVVYDDDFEARVAAAEAASTTGETMPIDPESLKQIQAEILAHMDSLQSIPADGKTTAGSVIGVAGKEIKLPDDVYIHIFLAAIDCPAGAECPHAPAYGLSYVDGSASITISSVNGKIFDAVENPEQAAANRVAFQWLVDAVAK